MALLHFRATMAESPLSKNAHNPHSMSRFVLALATFAFSAFTRILPAQAITQAAAQEDFDVLWKSIREAHGGLHRHVVAADLDRRVASHRARITGRLDVRTLAGILSESLAELRDGHARLELDSTTAASLSAAAVLPLRVTLEDDKLIVMSNDSPSDTTIRPGMEIVSINGHGAPELVRALLPRISGDGFIQTGKRSRLAREFAQHYWLAVEQRPTYLIVARDGSRTVSTEAPGILERDRRQVNNPVNTTFAANFSRLDGPPGNVAVDFPADGNVARLRVRAFGGEQFPASLDSAFRMLKQRGTQSLVLDLRGNGGGVDEYGALLVSYFVDRPFRYFDHIRVTTIAPSFATWPQRTFTDMQAGTVPDGAGGYRITSQRHPGVAEHQPGPVPFAGKLVILIDGGTFSTAADVAAQLRSMNRGVFVGEETGGGYEGNTSGLNALIVLPNSRLRLRIMMYDYWNAVRPPAERGRGTIPEYNDQRRVADVLRGVDPAMARALSVLR